jgi:hypothetical protein
MNPEMIYNYGQISESMVESSESLVELKILNEKGGDDLYWISSNNCQRRPEPPVSRER